MSLSKYSATSSSIAPSGSQLLTNRAPTDLSFPSEGALAELSYSLVNSPRD